jgi:hypothetical protein
MCSLSVALPSFSPPSPLSNFSSSAFSEFLAWYEASLHKLSAPTGLRVENNICSHTQTDRQTDTHTHTHTSAPTGMRGKQKSKVGESEDFEEFVVVGCVEGGG